MGKVIRCKKYRRLKQRETTQRSFKDLLSSIGLLDRNWAKQIETERQATKMRMFTGVIAGYKATALRERKKDGWRIRTWHENKDDQGQDYWVRDGQFYAIDIKTPFNTSIGKNVDDTVPRAKREAVLHLISKWKAEVLD
jgi:hypothetical protein